jgi:rfaE bifunctional protein nucleotidyltransferase chain/domain
LADNEKTVALSRAELTAWGERMRAARRIVAFTNGCFDILHRGHLDSFYRAAAEADELVVALNSDRSVRRLKGEARPLFGQEDRAALVAALRPVSAVTIFDEPTPLETIVALRPDVLVKGSEYTEAEIVGAPEVSAWGGRIVRVPMRAGWSTTQIIATIKNLAG